MCEENQEFSKIVWDAQAVWSYSTHADELENLTDPETSLYQS